MAEHWLRALNRTRLQPVPRGREHRDGTTSSRYPYADVCEHCGTPAPRNLFGMLRPHRAKARIRLKHALSPRAGKVCLR